MYCRTWLDPEDAPHVSATVHPSLQADSLSRLSFAARPGALLVIAMLAGCGLDSSSRPTIRARNQHHPASLIDGYLIARGMALSYGHSGRAGPAEIAQLVQYDHEALMAVVTAQLEPGDQRNLQAERALQALVDFTGENDLKPDPLPTSLPVR